MVLRLERPLTEGIGSLRAGRAWAAIASIGVLCALGALFVLRASPFPPGGLAGDQGFRVFQVAHDARHLIPGDFAYRSLPGYYPPLYFLALGRLVAATGMPAYEALKWGGIAVACLVPFVGFGLWRRCTGDVAVALGMVVAGLAVHEWYEPYAWIAAVAFVPWWCTYVVRPRGLPDRDSRRDVVVGSLVGAAILATYTYPFSVAAVQLVAVVVIARFRPQTARLRVTASSWKVLAGTALVSAPYWAPVVLRAALDGGFTPLQNRYFEHWMIAIPRPFLSPSPEGLVMLIGLVSLVVLALRGDALGRALLGLVGAAYAWFVLGYAAVLADSPLLAYRGVIVAEIALSAGAGLGLVRGWRSLRAQGTELPFRIVAGAAAVAALFLVVAAVDAIPYVAEQRAAKAPETLASAYDAAVRGSGSGGGDGSEGPDGVVLSAAPDLLMVRPVPTFNVWNAHYANPFADFADRSRFVARVGSERDPAVLAAALRHNRYDRVGVLVLDGRGSTLTYTDYQDAFPRGTRSRTVEFESDRFVAPWFHTSRAAGHTLIVATGRDPMGALDAAQREELRSHFAGDLA